MMRTVCCCCTNQFCMLRRCFVNLSDHSGDVLGSNLAFASKIRIARHRARADFYRVTLMVFFFICSSLSLYDRWRRMVALQSSLHQYGCTVKGDPPPIVSCLGGGGAPPPSPPPRDTDKDEKDRDVATSISALSHRYFSPFPFFSTRRPRGPCSLLP